ncbi:hypothetical protein KY290_001011 [Solanum tuberosum]|uniref:Uncharacterized protein n=1 Tax=Solanum tuberosum TaxID=4113 RepID=A0ABQ7WL41_SOLTU|nr:hypothetical protein KY290_001011 [Solanum tuberosum]
MLQVQRAIQCQPIDSSLQHEEKEKYAKFRCSSNMAEIFLQQRSKATWIKLGDDNTKYFFSVIKHRRLQHAITQLEDKHGVIQHEQEAIAAIMVDYYTELLGRKQIHRVRAFNSFLKAGRILDITKQFELIRPYTKKEVKQAMFSIDKNKSPGPDGYGSIFSKILGE